MAAADQLHDAVSDLRPVHSADQSLHDALENREQPHQEREQDRPQHSQLEDGSASATDELQIHGIADQHDLREDQRLDQ
jgi:hypothetical protein